MAGTYGWKFENTEEFIENEGESGTKEGTTSESESESENENESTNPYVKGYSYCCCCFSQDDPPDIHGPNEGPPGNSEKGYYWCANRGEIPEMAVKAGLDKDGGDIYIGRAVHEGELQPAKVIPNHGCAYIAYGGEEIRKDEYEILCGGPCTVIWQECEYGAVPPSAVPGGCTADNEKLYIGRVFHDGTHTPGKIQPSLAACYIPYGGEQLCFTNYEVLILQ